MHELVKQTARAKFDETIVVSMHLGVDPRHSDQLVRGTVVLPHGTGKSVRVLVLCKGDKVVFIIGASWSDSAMSRRMATFFSFNVFVVNFAMTKP